jgi:hypothetical protein
VQNAPDWDTCKPVYRQKGTELNYLEPQLAEGSGDLKILGLSLVASPFGVSKSLDRDEEMERNCMRSVKEVCGYVLSGPDGDLAEIVDFVIADKDWTMPYILLNAEDDSSSYRSRTVMVHTSCVTRISWQDQKIHCDISRKLLAACPYFASGSGAGHVSQYTFG